MFGKKREDSRKYNPEYTAGQDDIGGQKVKNPLTELLLCVFLGWIGAHKFYRKKIIPGILYVLTFGLFGIGWLGDSVLLLVRYFSNAKILHAKWVSTVVYLLAAVLVINALGGSGESSPANEAAMESVSAAIQETETQETSILETKAPETEPPETEATETVPPETEPPETEATKTEPPETEPPKTEPPETEPPETDSPETEPPETEPATTAPPTAAETVAETTKSTEAETAATHKYVLNTNSMKFHYPDCSSVDKISSSNRKDVTTTRDDLIAAGYSPCGRCHP